MKAIECPKCKEKIGFVLKVVEKSERREYVYDVWEERETTIVRVKHGRPKEYFVCPKCKKRLTWVDIEMAKCFAEEE